MKKFITSTLLIITVLGLLPCILLAQMKNLHGTDDEFRMGIHSGNLFRTSFFNDGTYGGRVNQPPQVAGEWPINSGHYYLVDGNIFVGSEVKDRTGHLIHILSENKSSNIGQSTGDKDPVSGAWWTFLPLPGFADPTNLPSPPGSGRVAMAKGNSEWPNSWPSYWPDKYNDPSDPGWRNDNIDNNPSKAAWNGYFGKNVFNADEESYFVADDYMNREFDFYPDSTDSTRKGLGLRIYVRGFQWAKAAVEDALFCLYDIENIGTYKHDKINFAYKIGNNMGESNNGPDSGDDNAAFVRELNLAYMTDNDDVGAGNWSPVGDFGGAFLESPGNPYDGIDNDNDGRTGPGINISEDLWQIKTLNPNDPIVLINYKTYTRTLTTLADTLAKLGTDTLEVNYSGRIYKFYAGMTLEEIGDNLIDDNLNGLIDENRGANDAEGIFRYLYIVDGQGYKCIDYFNPDSNTNGMTNLMLDERRDDGIDNDGDWDPAFDDVGADGLAPGATGYPGPDYGEGDGRPTSGEPHFDKTDIDETDMLGLTNCNLYEWTSVYQSDDEKYWTYMLPGIFSIPQVAINVELLFGSGYFPLVPGQIERISMGIICGTDYDDLVRNKYYVAEAYNKNYNFSKAPNIPTVRALAGDHKVTLFWDNFAEQSEDPISGHDFEGYRIYRSTDPGFNDMNPITDAYGTSTITPLFRKPLAQFDLDDQYFGLAAAPTQGVHFFLGLNTGLRHYWVDTTAVNGFTYFYAVTSYDHGDPVLGIDPSECTKYVAVQASGEIEKGSNVVVVRPEAPAAGYKSPQFKDAKIVSGINNTAQGKVNYEIVNSDSIKDNHTYRITFQDSINSPGYKLTKSFTLVDTTTQDTVLKNSTLTGDATEGLPITNGFKLSFADYPDSLKYIPDSSGWNRPGIPTFGFIPFRSQTRPVRPVDAEAGDYEIIFGEVGIDTSKGFRRQNTDSLVATPVNFTVINTITGKTVPFAFYDRTGNGSNKFDFRLSNRSSDMIILLTDATSGIASWQVTYIISSPTQADTITAGPGDVLTIKLFKPFLSHDIYTFTTQAATINPALAKADMEKIKVVPNPYIVTNSWEPQNPYANGRGERQLHFTHLPAKCTIHIFNIRGQLVNTLEHQAALNDGTEIWNMLSKDNLEISYGIYIYHVKADGIGEKIGKFAVIK
jgi:hypothetical protein